jgi:hypothetical protein
MAQSRNSSRRSAERSVVGALWIVAASIFVLGSLLRIAASEWAGYHLRINGVRLIALGLAFAMLAWLGERIIARRAPEPTPRS